MEELIAYYPWLSLEVKPPPLLRPPAAENAPRPPAPAEGAPRMMGDYRPRERVIRLRERRSVAARVRVQPARAPVTPP